VERGGKQSYAEPYFGAAGKRKKLHPLYMFMDVLVADFFSRILK
jgi:hypothetical protein